LVWDSLITVDSPVDLPVKAHKARTTPARSNPDQEPSARSATRRPAKTLYRYDTDRTGDIP